jgi:hypothetical protein
MFHNRGFGYHTSRIFASRVNAFDFDAAQWWRVFLEVMNNKMAHKYLLLLINPLLYLGSDKRHLNAGLRVAC